MTTVRAQITPDNSLGAESSSIGPDNIQGISFDRIRGGATRGANLFHSFGEFNVNNGQLVYFSNPAGIANILTRVTGVNRSNILGTLGVLGNANLFLINPNGIFFGPNARLDLGGSFFGSTANSLIFDNGFEFSATNPQAPPLLTVNIPIGLRFRDNPGNITNQSVVQDITGFPVGLQVNPGNSLALVGGNVSLEQGGSLTAAGGKIELGGLTGAGTVGLETTGNTFKLNFPANSSLSNVSLADEAQATVRGNGGGDIAVNANIFTATNGGQLVAGVEGIATRNGGDITVNSNDISFDGVSSNGFTSGIFNNVQGNATNNANAGGIDITTKTLSLFNGATINAVTFGRGNAGTVKIQASDISFDGVGRTGFPSGIFSTVQGNAVGNAGGIDITTQTLSLFNGAVVNASTFATGDAGRIKIQASDISVDGVGSTGFSSGIFSTVQENGVGNGGGIDITTGTLSLRNGAAINAITFGRGNAGSVKIQASDISVDGVGSTGFSSGIFSTVQGNAEGNAGGIDITTGTLSLFNGAVINASTFATGDAGTVKIQASDSITASGVGSNEVTSSIRSNVQSGARGDAGGIDISTKNLFFTNGAEITANTFGNGNAGTVKIQASDISFDGVSSNGFTSGIFNNVEGDAVGNAGGIDITTQTLSLLNGAALTASTFNEGNAGSVKIQASDISLNGVGSNGRSSGIFSSVAENGRGNAGGIDISTGTLSLLDGAQIGAGIFGTGNAGNVTINASDRVSFAGFGSGAFSAVESGASGDAGNIIINAASIFLDDRAVLRTTNGSNGFAGDITLNARDQVSITNNSTISSDGNLGRIFIGSQSGRTDALSLIPNIINIDNSTLSTTNNSTGFAGDITLNARAQVSITNSTVSSEGNLGSIFIGSSDTTNALSVLPSRINIDNSTLNTTNSNTDFAGNIRLNARDEIFIKDSTISSNGNFGQIFIGDANSFLPALVRIEGANTRLSTENNTAPEQNAGSINIAAGRVVMNLGEVSSNTSGSGRAGDISVQASGSVEFVDNALFSNVLSGAQNSQAGDITIKAGSFSLLNGGQLQSRVLRGGQGSAGNVTIDVQGGTVRIVGANPQGFPSGIFNDVELTDSSNAGDIIINAASIFLDDGALLRTRNASNGLAGDITLNARDQVSIDRSTIESTGQEGRIFIGQSINNAPAFVPSSININNSTVSTTNSGTTFAGDIALNARDQVSLNQSTIESNGNFGFIFIGKNDTYGDRTSSPRVVKLEGSSLSATNDNITGADDTPFNAGNISIDAIDSISLNNQSFIQALTRRRGNAGNVTLRAENGDISLAGGSYIFSTVESGGTGNAGKIDVITRNLSLTDGSELQTLVRAGQQGDAGNITVQASGNVSFSGFNNIDLGGNSGLFPSGIFSQVQSAATGSGGDIKITAKNLSLNNSAQINASTFGIGNAGNVSVRVDDAIALGNSSEITSLVGPGGEGIGGDIDIRGRSLTLTGGSQIGTVLLAEGNGLSGGKGRAGNIDINATDFVNIFGVGITGFSSGLFASAETGTTAISPQAAGNINLTTGDFRIADGAVVDALTSNSGDAGNITINAKTFTANGGGQVITTTFNSGSAGDINLNIRDRITISGSDPNYNQRIEGTFDNQGAASGIFANTASGSTGNGGNITIQPRQNSRPRIAIADGGEVTVDSLGQGVGGEISITGNSLTLDRGTISASTASADGGNINLRLRNFLRLQNESLISANAGGQQNGGNGGNIRINTPFIVAFPQNNDIIANARSGSGGQVTTNATLFGIVPRTRADLERLGVPSLDPRNLSTSDITAFSEQNSNFGDNVLVNSPDVDPSRGLVELPETVSDPTQRIAQNPCQQGIGNEFVVTGRGGFPTNPNQTLSSDNVRVDLLQPVASTVYSRSAAIKPATNPTATRVPAQGWIFNDKGQVVLTAYDPTNTGSQRSFSTAACPAR
ncbi:S-layer family protein [Hassallia byssoidea VB512170]|uniref:S-layer family protein n=1 Tax=Hassallia byssoidea VB512170 TaxID=1304833 RepID=A0A846H9C2_9CYAN|nr:filamentous hemagglutinin N-terminal domain-containing protein [Hassalia byssoidea]NEU73051.1 S-layer family protein [Hassalia byssoidea VB512170]